MNRRAFLGSIAVSAIPGMVLAGSPAPTVIEVANMHCADCAKKIANKLYGVPGVVAVRANIQANTATITPQQQRQPSPKAMWEAVEKAGFKPLRLAGPLGTFDSKPGV